MVVCDIKKNLRMCSLVFGVVLMQYIACVCDNIQYREKNREILYFLEERLCLALGKGFVCLIVFSRTSIFSAIWRLSPLPVTGLQI
jgi:hypothetical protein